MQWYMVEGPIDYPGIHYKDIFNAKFSIQEATREAAYVPPNTGAGQPVDVFATSGDAHYSRD